MSATRVPIDPSAPPPVSTDWWRVVRFGFLLIVLTFVGLGGWSAVASIDSAVVAEGTVVVESNRKTIQHLEGGIVAEILSRDGSIVRQGDVLLRLDRTRNEATERTFRRQLAIALAGEARMAAQRDMLEA